MVARRARVPVEKRPRETTEIMTKPLPQILDEMAASIKAAREAAEAARHVFEEAAKRAEKATALARGAASAGNVRGNTKACGRQIRGG